MTEGLSQAGMAEMPVVKQTFEEASSSTLDELLSKNLFGSDLSESILHSNAGSIQIAGKS